MIIYEVNIQVAEKIYTKYIEWLDSHIIEMLRFEGFLKSKKFLDKNYSNNEYMYITVHYYLKSLKHLENYLNNNAKKMRTISDEKFINNITITRRVLHDI